MRTVLNLLWLVLAGVWLALAYVVAGVIMFVFVVTIPFGVQAFKLAGYSLWPFGRTVVDRPGSSSTASAIGNVLWLLLAGIWLALGHLVTGALLCLTVVGIPLGVANFKLVPLALLPFGKEIVPADRADQAFAGLAAA